MTFLTTYRKPISATDTVNWMQAKNPAGKSKVMVDRALNSLVSEGKLLMKEFGRAKVYWVEIPPPSEEELAAVDTSRAKIKALTTETIQMKEETTTMGNEARRLLRDPTDEELDAAIAAQTADTDTLRARLEQVQNSADVVDEATTKREDAVLTYLVKLWRTRRRNVMEIVGQMSEGMDKPVGTIVKDLGLETDEDAGVDFSDVAGLVGMGKRAR